MRACIQARGALIAYRAGGPIVAASENAEVIFGSDPLGSDPAAVLGPEGLHAVRNMASIPSTAERSIFTTATRGVELHTHVADGLIIVEAEPVQEAELPSPYEIERDVALILGADSVERRTDLVRTLSGFQGVAFVETLEGMKETTSPDLLVLDDISREAVRIRGEVPRLDRLWLRCPDPETEKRCRSDGVSAAVVLRGRCSMLTMTHPRPRLPNHRTRLVLLHLGLVL